MILKVIKIDMMFIVVFCLLLNKFDKVFFVVLLKKGKLLIMIIIELNIVKGKESINVFCKIVR